MDQSQYIPLTNNDSHHPTLLIDSHAPVSELHASALYRLRAVTELMETLAGRELERASQADLQNVANAAMILLRDGCDLLDVLGRKLRG